jgi:hypothetical protein
MIELTASARGHKKHEKLILKKTKYYEMVFKS